MYILKCAVLLFLIASLLIIDLSFIVLLIEKIKSSKRNKKLAEKAVALGDILTELADKLEEEELEFQPIDENDFTLQPIEKNNDSMTINYNTIGVRELKKLAKERNIKGYYNMKKDELVARLSEERA